MSGDKTRWKPERKRRAEGSKSATVIVWIMQMTRAAPSTDSRWRNATAARLLVGHRRYQARCCDARSELTGGWGGRGGGHSPWVFSMKTTLESELKFCPVRIICWPPRTEQLSMSCFSTMGSSWAERWAAGTHRGGQRVTFTVSRWPQNATLSQRRA